MPLFLVFNTTYSTVDLGIFDDNILVCQKTIEKKLAHKNLLITCDQLLQSYNYSLKNIAALIAMTGPAPFTTLRVVLSTINGLHTASKIPLIGVDGLLTFYANIYDTNYPQTIILLDAFNDEFYYGIQDTNGAITTGYATSLLLATRITELMPYGSIRFIGNGIIKMKPILTTSLNNRAYFAEDMPDTCTLEQVAHAGMISYINNNFNTGYTQLLPIYLKMPTYTPSQH